MPVPALIGLSKPLAKPVVMILYVEYENCKRPKEIDDYKREFANMADFRR